MIDMKFGTYTPLDYIKKILFFWKSDPGGCYQKMPHYIDISSIAMFGLVFKIFFNDLVQKEQLSDVRW